MLVSVRPDQHEATRPTNILTLQTADLININTALGLEDLDDQSQPDGNFRCSNCDHEEDEDLSTKGFDSTAESHDGKIGGVQHQLNGHENDERIAANEHTGHADGEQDR